MWACGTCVVALRLTFCCEITLPPGTAGGAAGLCYGSNATAAAWRRTVSSTGASYDMVSTTAFGTVLLTRSTTGASMTTRACLGGCCTKPRTAVAGMQLNTVALAAHQAPGV